MYLHVSLGKQDWNAYSKTSIKYVSFSCKINHFLYNSSIYILTMYRMILQSLPVIYQKYIHTQNSGKKHLLSAFQILYIIYQIGYIFN